MASLLNNYVFQGLGRLSVAWNSVNISDDIERGLPVSFNDAYVVAKNKKGNIIERMRGDATGGVMTLSLRGLDQSNMNVEVPSLRREREEKTIYYVTLLAVQLVDKQADNTFGGTQTFNDIVADDISANSIALTAGSWTTIYANTAARDAALGGDGAALHPYQSILAGGVFWNYNTATAQWESVDTGTVTPNATTTSAGKARIATDAQAGNWTDTSWGDPLFITPSQLQFALAAISFWDGSDGDVTIAGTVTLTRDMYYNNLIIPTATTLNPNGYRVFVKGTFSGVGNVTMIGNAGGAGGNGAFSTAGTSGAAATILNQGSLNANVASWAGGTWPVNAAGTPGAAGTAASPTLSNTNWVAWGVGGARGANAWGLWGVWGTSTRGEYYNKAFPLFFVHPATAGTGLVSKVSWSAGGGWGGGSEASQWGGWGGWGGSNGGLFWISCKIWDFTGIVNLTGGAGGAGGQGSNNGVSVNWGGWGGGWGHWGILLRMYHTLLNDCTSTLTGGAGGAPGAGGNGGNPGLIGTAGNTGVVVSIVI
jgi:hypothetical protein